MFTCIFTIALIQQPKIHYTHTFERSHTRDKGEKKEKSAAIVDFPCFRVQN